MKVSVDVYVKNASIEKVESIEFNSDDLRKFAEEKVRENYDNTVTIESGEVNFECAE